MSTATTRVDIYEAVTNKIVAQLERGVCPWMQPWQSNHAAGAVSRPLRSNMQPYSGVNILSLWMSAEDNGFGCPIWLTFKQALELGGHVKKGERGSPVFYASTFKKTEAKDNGEEIERDIPFLKQYTVFNADQCEGLPDIYYATVAINETPNERIESVAQFVANTRADVRELGNSAYYTITDDYIQIPKLAAFRDAESHAATLIHELMHWTRHPSRLNREFGRKRFGDAGYAMEELVAELGAAFLSSDLGVAPELRDDHAQYIASWLKVLKDDKRAIFTAASWANKAAEYLHGLQPG